MAPVHGSSYIDEQNESANEDEINDNDDSTVNILNDVKSHQNMSDITNIQIQLDNIQVCLRPESDSHSSAFNFITKLRQKFGVISITANHLKDATNSFVKIKRTSHKKSPIEIIRTVNFKWSFSFVFFFFPFL